MTLTALDEQLQQIARDVFADDSLVLSDAMQATDVPAWDSLAHVNFIYSIEEAFDVRFSEEEFTGFANVGELKAILRRKLEPAGV
jgi:acyl carrier protein